MDWPCSNATGVEQAKQAGRLLKAEGYDFDVAYTSVLKRATRTLWHTLDELDRTWLPVVHSWRLNERHYGGLQGLNKAETAKKYGDEQVRWEWHCLDRAAAIAFWVPRDLTTLPGFTTNVEFGLYCRSGRAFLGYPQGAPRMRYLDRLARAQNVPVFHDLFSLLQAVLAGAFPASKEPP